ncbi:MAG: substrate-binding domain-containing protein [Acidobacteria bacterium]|nr:substrate-binding domain-containing protein [Acidobacteriota bacterium]
MLDKGLTVLEAVESAAQPLTIQEISAHTGLQRLAVYRLLNTLQSRGYVQRSEDKRYRASTRRRRMLVGYLAPLEGNQFRLDVAASIERAAATSGLEVLLRHNDEADTAAALANTRELIAAHIDVAILFQPVEAIGYQIAELLSAARVPFLTVERPIQGGIYFGANNYQAGKLAGQALGHYARERWRGRFDRVVLVEGPQTRTSVQARLAGVLVGLEDVLGPIPPSAVLHIEGGAHTDASRQAMARLIRRLPSGTRLLVAGFNDLSAIGALEAVQAAGRARDVIIVGHNAAREGRAAILRPGSCLLASVAFFPERYGDRLVRLASSIVDGQPLPPAVYTDHAVIHRSNLRSFYPDPHA